jgi:hypothetical protein
VKRDDAPMSSAEHLNEAIVILSSLLPNYASGDHELDKELQSIKDNYKLAYGEQFEEIFGFKI